MLAVSSSDNYYVVAQDNGKETKIRCYDKYQLSNKPVETNIIHSECLREVSDVANDIRQITSNYGLYFNKRLLDSEVFAFEVGDVIFLVEITDVNIKSVILTETNIYEFFNHAYTCDHKLIKDALTAMLTHLFKESLVFNIDRSITAQYLADIRGLKIELDPGTNEEPPVHMLIPNSPELVFCISGILQLVNKFISNK